MESTNPNLDNILSKLRKLKALYEGAKEINSEGEANAAAAAIQRLLTQYNLSVDEIGTDEQKKEDVVVDEKTSGFTYKSIGGEWEQRLVYVICKWNFCRCFVYGKSYRTLLLVGKKENLETVKWLREMLSERFVSFSKKRFKEYQKTREYASKPISMDKYQRSYLMGCAAGLDAKLKEESDRDKAKNIEYGTKVNALVVRNDTAVAQFVSKKFGKVESRKTRESNDSAREFGFRDGKNTELHKQVSSGAKKQSENIKLLGK